MSQFQDCETISPLSNSDHYGLDLSLKWRSAKRPAQNSNRTIWKRAQADFIKARDLIDALGFSAM